MRFSPVFRFRGVCFTVLLASSCLLSPAYAQTVPSSADAGRVETKPQPSIPEAVKGDFPLPRAEVMGKAPENAKSIFFNLKKVNVEGVSAFKQSKIAELYQGLVGKRISLDNIWNIAERITNLYRQNEYFLSRAYIPEQEVQNGVITIRVVEGYISSVVFNKNTKHSKVPKELVKRLTGSRPLKASELESFLLRMNDLPGNGYFGVLRPLKSQKDGAVELVLKEGTKKRRGTVSFDNSGSRYLGPYMASASYQLDVGDNHRITISASSSIPANELNYTNIEYTTPISPEWNFYLSGGYIHASPGANIKVNDILSQSIETGIGLIYQPIRQWRENLKFSFKFTTKDTESSLLSSELTRDHIRAARVGAIFDKLDGWNGYHYSNIELSQGLDTFGASAAGSRNLSRSAAKPDFTKLKMQYAYQRYLPANLMFIGQGLAQLSSKPLYSYEEVGYGGAAFGRAYDPSEITGDSGLMGSAEFRYMGFKPVYDATIAPYVFYDIGRIWNRDSTTSNVTAASTGGGLKLNAENGLNADIGAAWPLVNRVSKPLYGNPASPRFMVKLGYRF